jgi:hypothetical protein
MILGGLHATERETDLKAGQNRMYPCVFVRTAQVNGVHMFFLSISLLCFQLFFRVGKCLWTVGFTPY